MRNRHRVQRVQGSPTFPCTPRVADGEQQRAIRFKNRLAGWTGWTLGRSTNGIRSCAPERQKPATAMRITPDKKASYRAQPIGRRSSMSDLITTKPPGLPSAERRERMAQQARASKAERTWRAYGSDWRIWEAWAAANGVDRIAGRPPARRGVPVRHDRHAQAQHGAPLSGEHLGQSYAQGPRASSASTPRSRRSCAVPRAGRRCRAECGRCSPSRSGRS